MGTLAPTRRATRRERDHNDRELVLSISQACWYSERQGCSQYAPADRTGLSKQALSQLEQGGNPACTTVQLIVRALGVDYAALADPALELPAPEPSRPRGRPRKTPATALALCRSRSPK